ncbi:MAG: GNAT family N-acetyltransferase [Candidatus Pristimantibacillus sp.]
MKLIPSKWNTSSFVIENLDQSEIGIVQELYKSSSNSSEWDGNEYDAAYINTAFHSGILPPEGIRDHFRIQTIRSRDQENELIGFINIYYGYPFNESIYLAFLCIDKKYQKHGCGQETIKQLILEARKMEYTEIRVNVSLKNWSALRFWTQSGFNQISGIFGDKELSEDKFADIELVNDLRWDNK